MKRFIWLIAALFVFRLILSFIAWHPDVNNHIDWGIRFWEYGPAKFFAPETNIWSFTWPNQPPGTIYLFAGVRKLYEFIFNIFWTINLKISIFPSDVIFFLEKSLYPALLKLPSILADIGIAYILYKWTNKRLASFLWLINPVIWYNSALWGQTDAIVNFFALLAFYLLLQRKLALSLFFLVLGFYTKASLFIFFPLYLVVAIRQKYKISQYATSILYSLIPIALITLPFSQGEPFSWLINLYQTKVFGQQLQIITANAFNIWAALSGIHEQPQTLPFLGLTYQYWGYILFTLSFVPILYSIYKRQDAKTVVWALALTAFSSWMLLTNMHERYLYPLFPYLTILVTINLISLYPYILISLISLLNLYNFWWVPKLDLLISFLSFGDRLIPRLLGFFGFILFLQLYIKHFLQSHLLRKGGK